MEEEKIVAAYIKSRNNTAYAWSPKAQNKWEKK